MSHALVVGGTGMLREASLALASRFQALTVVARRAERLDRLAADLPLGYPFHPLALDWADDEALTGGLARAQAASGPIDLAVCWIHGSAPRAPGLVARSIAPARYVHVVGSAAAEPGRVGGARREAVASVAGIRYTQAILGFVLQGRHARWLTDAEISAGVLCAVDSDADPYVVGTIRPWERRP